MTDNQENQHSPEVTPDKNLLIKKLYAQPHGTEMTPEELAEAERAHYIDSVLLEYFPDYDPENPARINEATYQRDRLNQAAYFADMMGATGIVTDRARDHGSQYYRQQDLTRVAECASTEELQRFMDALKTLQQKFDSDMQNYLHS